MQFNGVQLVGGASMRVHVCTCNCVCVFGVCVQMISHYHRMQSSVIVSDLSHGTQPTTTTADVTTADVTTAHVTTAEVTTADVTTAEVITSGNTNAGKTGARSLRVKQALLLAKSGSRIAIVLTDSRSAALSHIFPGVIN